MDTASSNRQIQSVVPYRNKAPFRCASRCYTVYNGFNSTLVVHTKLRHIFGMNSFRKGYEVPNNNFHLPFGLKKSPRVAILNRQQVSSQSAHSYQSEPPDSIGRFELR
jgi:hypothetical protein